MVVNLSVGKGEFDDRYEQLCSIAERAQAVKDLLVRMVDEDTQAFDSVLTSMRMPQGHRRRAGSSFRRHP